MLLPSLCSIRTPAARVPSCHGLTCDYVAATPAAVALLWSERFQSHLQTFQSTLVQSVPKQRRSIPAPWALLAATAADCAEGTAVTDPQTYMQVDWAQTNGTHALHIICLQACHLPGSLANAASCLGTVVCCTLPITNYQMAHQSGAPVGAAPPTRSHLGSNGIFPFLSKTYTMAATSPP